MSSFKKKSSWKLPITVFLATISGGPLLVDLLQVPLEWEYLRKKEVLFSSLQIFGHTFEPLFIPTILNLCLVSLRGTWSKSTLLGAPFQNAIIAHQKVKGLFIVGTGVFSLRRLIRNTAGVFNRFDKWTHYIANHSKSNAIIINGPTLNVLKRR